MRHKFHIIKVLGALFASVMLAPQTMGAPRIHCQQDSAKASEMLAAATALPSSGERIIDAARRLVGTKIGESALQDTVGTAEINLHELTPLDFASTVLAVAKAASESRNPRYEDFAEAFVDISRRRGQDGLFSSRLLYGSDWVVDNVYRGNLSELTERLTDNVFKTRSLDHFTSHRNDYAPLRKDSMEWENVRMVEMGYRSHKVPYMRKQTIAKRDVKDRINTGDILIMLCKESDRDIWDIGFLDVRPDGIFLIHADPITSAVVEESVPIERFFKLNGQYFIGYRLVQPTL